MPLATTRFVQALVDLENAQPDALFEHLASSPVPLWPQVRSNMALALSEREFTSVAVSRDESRLRSTARALRAILPSRWEAATLRRRRAVVYFTSGVTTAPRNGRQHNWLIGDFAAEFPGESAILQWADLSRRPEFPPTRTLAPLKSRAEVIGRIRGGPVDTARARRLIKEYARLLGGGFTEQQIDSIVTSATYGHRMASALEHRLDRLIDRLKPRVVFFDSPVDGGWGRVIARLKAGGIRVVEPQHGWVGPGHAAYNFGAAMWQPSLRAQIPDELLTFGRFWGRDLRFPGVVTAIGKPHFEQAMQSAPPLSERPREVLVLSSVGDPGRASDFVRAVAGLLPASWSIAFRPHPSEMDVASERYPSLISDARIRLDDRPDIYEALAQSRIVVGVASTGLFEAAGMGCRVFVRDTPYVPIIVGDLFGAPLSEADGPDRIAQAAETDAWDDPAADTTELWAPGALGNFRGWMSAYM